MTAFGPDVIVHSMILNDFAAMYADRELAWRSFVGTTETLARAADEVGAKLILVSTDWVFDGTQSGADEDTPPNPVNFYGVLKMASEQAAMLTAERAAVARVSAVSGMHWMRESTPRVQDGGFGYFVTSIVDALEAGQPFGVWEADDINMVATPSLASECGEVMWRIAADESATGGLPLLRSRIRQPHGAGRPRLRDLRSRRIVAQLDPARHRGCGSGG